MIKQEEQVDRAALGVMVVYVTQMEGRPTIEEIHGTIKNRIGYSVGKIAVKNAVLSAKKRGLLSINYDIYNGVKEERFSLKDVRWSNPPEIAHIKTHLPVLLETEEAKRIHGILEGIHEVGEKKGRTPDICDYVRYRITYENVVPILGGEPGDKIKFRRNNGHIWFAMELWMRGALRNQLRMRNVSVSKVQYINVKDVFLEANKTKTVFIPRPQPGRPGQGGTGIKDYEAILNGLKFDVEISFPTKGFMKESAFIELLDGIRIGARHREYGLLKLLKAEKIG